MVASAAVAKRYTGSWMAVVLEEVFPVAAAISDTNFCVAVVLEVAVPADVAKKHSGPCLAVVCEEVVPAYSWSYQTWLWRVEAHSSCYLQPLQVGIAVSNTC